MFVIQRHRVNKLFSYCRKRILIASIVSPFIIPSTLFSEVVPKHYSAKRVTSEINVDGIPNESVWDSANIADQFAQLDPVEGAPITQITEVRVLYDNSAIYISAVMKDTHADSILHQLGNRDEGAELNSDAFRFAIDPYNTRENGYVFEVSASGVQTERWNDDVTFDAVWQSAVNISDSGWTAEMKIPYSAVRFPVAEEQKWGVQFARSIRRNREYDQWTLTPKNIQNRMLFWGTMEGINNIDPPLRLSLTPYFSIYAERSPYTKEDGNTGYENSYSYYGGADIKYGIDERFTLDMTLLPDFSQVQSDNKVKNLSAYETIYEERRPFFKEGTNLLSQGNLFYSRRIGRTPGLYYDVPDLLESGETIDNNPDKAKLVNSTKVSGRTDKGLGIGFLNAVTANTYATVSDRDGNKRKILTEPLTNYNLFVFDQQLKNNCNIFLVNTNVMRDGSARDANVTTAQGRFENKKHQYRITGSYSLSQVHDWETDESGNSAKKNKKGTLASLNVDKISGTSWYGGSYEIGTKNYDRNDMGYIFVTDYSYQSLYYTYNMFNPFWKYFKQGNVSVFTNASERLSNNNEFKDLQVGYNFFLLFNNNWSIYTDGGFQPLRGKDYNEPRIDDRYFKTAKSNYGSVNFTTDYNRKLAFDFGGRYNNAPYFDNTNLGYYIVPRVRLSDHFNFVFSHYYDEYNNDRGFAYASANNDSSFFGKRDIVTIENSISAKYLFKNDMSITLTARDYWSKGNYENYYFLEQSGELTPITVDDVQAYDFNSNYFTVDLIYNWQFAPGSSFLITYKNLIQSDTQFASSDYISNFSDVFSNPQVNSISLKVLYYLDYQYLVKKKS